jgi:hypothetical protein
MERFDSSKTKIEQENWLKLQGFEVGDILQQGCYPIMKIHWYKEYKMYGLICKSWHCFHFFGDLYLPDKCQKYEGVGK